MNAKIYQNKKYIVFFLIPAFLFMLVYLYVPFITNIMNSFKNIKYLASPSDVWQKPFFENYVKMLHDPKIAIALKNTGIMILATIIGEVGIAIILALLVSNVKKGADFYRITFFFPIVISATALALLFNLVFLYDKGMVNQFLQFIGYLDKESNELIDWKTVHPLFTMMLPIIWQYVGFYFVIILTAISGISNEYYEAAALDGASKFQQAWYVTLPLIRNSIATCAVLAVTGALKVFDLPWTMFVNGMSNTWLTGTYMYSKVQTDVDYASAIAVGIVVLGALLSVVANIIFKRKSDYEI